MEPTAAEQTESLEQLRALENGYTIRVILTDKRFYRCRHTGRLSSCKCNLRARGEINENSSN